MVSDEVKRARRHGLIESFEELRNVKGVTIALRTDYELGWRRGIRLNLLGLEKRPPSQGEEMSCENQVPKQGARLPSTAAMCTLQLPLATLSQAVSIRGGKICYVAEYTSSASPDCYNA